MLIRFGFSSNVRRIWIRSLSNAQEKTRSTENASNLHLTGVEVPPPAQKYSNPSPLKIEENRENFLPVKRHEIKTTENDSLNIFVFI